MIGNRTHSITDTLMPKLHAFSMIRWIFIMPYAMLNLYLLFKNYPTTRKGSWTKWDHWYWGEVRGYWAR